ncbi:Acid phosphatase [Handroanthus impetiginosus]|uniref:Acid phosphatase n=1 Tax=Handroanthus impetiginosus TaxID=429701 RepID=A0A2G9GUV1_9LAMI|nr:Acid phosphatase [Handroanthus impetiginosus]
MKEKSWVCTLITQLSLCVAVYIALNVGQPQKYTHGKISNGGRPIDMYFISVAGGFRPLEEQALLLQQMAKVAKIYKARFVVDITELGESDPLLQNAMKFPELRNVPWYTTGASGRQGATYFLKKIKIPYRQTLDVIVLDTMLFQDVSSMHGNDQILWLTRTLNESNTDWRIVIGFHQLFSCDYNSWKMEEENPFKHLHNILLRYGVDAYISMKTCAGVAMGLSDTAPMNKRLYLTAINQNFASKEETINGFLLHQVSSLEMVTFIVKPTGEVDDEISFQQRGRAVM